MTRKKKQEKKSLKKAMQTPIKTCVYCEARVWKPAIVKGRAICPDCLRRIGTREERLWYGKH